MVSLSFLIILGHSFVGHHHSNTEVNHGHYHHDFHKYSYHEHHTYNNNKDFDLGDLFANIQHGEDELLFLNSELPTFSNSTLLTISLFIHKAYQYSVEENMMLPPKQKIPPDKESYTSLLANFIYGLRAPPHFIV